MNTCNCLSYNKPEWGGDKPEIILPTPSWSERKNGICVDACISDAILMLWENGIMTEGCCCGHNKNNPSVVISTNSEGNKTKELLKLNDGRDWEVMQWQLVKL